MKKFNIRKVLDGLKEASSSTPIVQVGPQENHLIPESLQSEHFQLCKVGPISSLQFTTQAISQHVDTGPHFTLHSSHEKIEQQVYLTS